MDQKNATREPKWALAAILAAFVILSLSYSFATRLKFGPDEPAHFIYIRSLAVDFAPPPIANEVTPTEDSTSTHEGHQPPLYYALMAVPFGILKAVGVSSDTIWRVLRLLNIPIGAAWVYLIYVLSSEFFRKKAYALAVAAFVALIPSSAYMSGVVNNDVLISLFFTWALIPMVTYFKSGAISPRSAAFMGLIIGLAVLTKAQGLILIPMLLIASLAVCHRARYSNWRATARSSGIVISISGLVFGWWFARCWYLYGTMMPHSLYKPMLPGGAILLLSYPGEGIGLIRTATEFLYGYFWLPYWLVQPFVGWSAYLRPVLILTALGLIGLLMRLRRDGDLDRRTLTLLLFPLIATYLLWLRYVISVDVGANMQGRLLLPVASVMGILAVLGFDGWLRSARMKIAGLVVGMAAMVVLNLWVIRCVLAFYSA